MMERSEAQAYEYVRAYAAKAASELGFELNYRR
jgi:hypothetical protein